MNVWNKIKSEFHKGGSAIHQIVVVILGVFIFSTLVSLAGKLAGFNAIEFLNFFYLPSQLTELLHKPWTIVTNIFFHKNLRHLIGNIVILYFIGKILEEFMSVDRVWKIFIFGGLSGCILFLVSYNTLPFFLDVVNSSALIGASGGLAAIIAAAGLHVPYFILRPFGLFEMKMNIASALLLFIMLSFPLLEGNTGGFFAHSGGAIFGALFVLQLQGKLNFIPLRFTESRPSNMKKAENTEDTVHKTPVSSSKRIPEQDEIDAILDKISSSGYDSLTKDEKELLFSIKE